MFHADCFVEFTDVNRFNSSSAAKAHRDSTRCCFNAKSLPRGLLVHKSSCVHLSVGEGGGCNSTHGKKGREMEQLAAGGGGGLNSVKNED